jgi:hypothetical protein
MARAPAIATLVLSAFLLGMACADDAKRSPHGPRGVGMGQMDGSADGSEAGTDAALGHDATARDDAALGDDAALSDDAALGDDAALSEDAALTGECADAMPLRCGDRFSHSTLSGGESRFDFYACTARSESGPENTYALETDAGCRARVSLSELETDLDLFAFDTCDALSCSQYSTAPLDLQDFERIELSGAPERTLLVVVDGYGGSSGTYTLAVDCLCGPGAVDFGDGTWRLQADRRWAGDFASAPTSSTPLDEADYEPLAAAVAYDVTIDGRWQLAHIGDMPWAAELRESSAGQLHYELTDGATAGGRFVIRSTAAGLEAEITLYGSGVPIALSERGRLVRR